MKLYGVNVSIYFIQTRILTIFICRCNTIAADSFLNPPLSSHSLQYSILYVC